MVPDAAPVLVVVKVFYPMQLRYGAWGGGDVRDDTPIPTFPHTGGGRSQPTTPPTIRSLYLPVHKLVHTHTARSPLMRVGNASSY